MTSSDSRRALPPLTFEGASIAWLMKILSISVLGLFVSMNLGRVYSQAAERAADFKANHAWVSPLEISPRLSGNFGELRGNHFHTGVDLKTEGREGLVVLAATSGRVARVKMSPWGYGNALYLEGPDDVTTVYAHLQRFAPRVQQWAVQRTYKTRTLGLDAAPSAGDSLYFEAGDTLGWSGNSGGSGGPHLHFEVRQTSNQHPLNPLDGWLDKSDSRKPVLPKLWAESELGMRSWSWTEDTVRVPLKVRFAVEGYDLLDGASNICGLRTLEATLTTPDGEQLLVYEASWGELDFGVNKDMNAHAFYPIWSRERDQVHRLHRVLTNRLGIYGTPQDDGFVQLSLGETARLEVVATDGAGNTTRKQLVIQGVRAETLDSWESMDMDWEGASATVAPNASGEAQFGEARLSWGKGTFFETTDVGWEMEESRQGGTLHAPMVPFRRSIDVSWPLPGDVETWEGSWVVLPGEAMPEDRWVAVQRNTRNELEAVEMAQIEDGMVSVQLSRTGAWRLERDTVPPKVLPYHSASPLVASGDAVWFVDDALSGIREIELRLDGRWARLVWDPKRNMVTYEATDALHARGRSVKAVLTVEDEVGNVEVWEGGLVWP